MKESEFWQHVYLASIRAGHSSEYANDQANRAVFNRRAAWERFKPAPRPEPDFGMGTFGGPSGAYHN